MSKEPIRITATVTFVGSIEDEADREILDHVFRALEKAPISRPGLELRYDSGRAKVTFGPAALGKV